MRAFVTEIPVLPDKVESGPRWLLKENGQSSIFIIFLKTEIFNFWYKFGTRLYLIVIK